MRFGRTFEEFEVGEVYRHWPGKTITESDDHLFCLITMNHHPLHLDAHYAGDVDPVRPQCRRRQPHLLAAARHVVPDVSGKAIANLEVESLRHVAPTFHGDTLYGETTVLDKRESASRPDRGVVQVETRGYNQDGTWCASSGAAVIVPTQDVPRRPRRRPAGPAGAAGRPGGHLESLPAPRS